MISMLIRLRKLFLKTLKKRSMSDLTLNYLIKSWRTVRNIEEYMEWAFTVRTLLVDIPPHLSIATMMDNPNLNFINTWERDSLVKEIIEVRKHQHKYGY